MSDSRYKLVVGVAIAAITVSTCFTALQMNAMGNRIEALTMELRNVQGSIISQVTGEASSIMGAIDSQGSALAFKEVIYGGFDIKTMTQKAKVVIVPRNHGNGIDMKITAGVGSVPLTSKGAEWVGEIDVPVFGHGQITVVLTEGDRHENVVLESYSQLWKTCLLDLNGRFDGSLMMTDGSSVIKYSGEVVLDSLMGQDFAGNIKVISDRDGTVKVVKSQIKEPGAHFVFPLSIEVERPKRYHRLSLEVTDASGLTYTIDLQEDQMDQKGVLTSSMTPWTGIVKSISAKDGKILYRWKE